jgi:beta-glucosidase
MSFQSDFFWGAGSAAYQTEGGWYDDGKGASIWDEFCHTPGKVKNAETGDVAADAYHRAETDLALIQSLGLSAYRFSVSWPRVLPEGRGKINEKGLEYYDRIVDKLLAMNVTPFITLYHWDLPLALEREGGWQNRDTAEAFAEYAALVARRFDGRVKHYITLNEPQCFLGMGYGSGIHAPGKKLGNDALAQCIHHALLAHGGAAEAMRAAVSGPLQIGLASTGKICYPSGCPDDGASEASGDTALKAAYDATFSLKESPASEHNGDWTFSHTWLFDAAVFGRYPEEFEFFRSLNDAMTEQDRNLITTPMDFIGLNAYSGTPVDRFGNRVRKAPGFSRTALKWPITPECLYFGPRFLYERYKLPVIITENGQSCNDRIFLDGAVHDPDRIDFLSRYLRQLRRAIEDGVPVKGYFHWSLTDNFEWHSGYDERFGLAYVDYETQKRTIKDSGYWYRDIIKNNGNF